MSWQARALAFGFVAAALTAATHASAACVVDRGQRILLFSQQLDPNVFVWDSAKRLIDYTNGDDDVNTVMKHTLLAMAGTKAVVTDCRSSLVRKRPEIADDSILGVKIGSGIYKGRYGWILAVDARHDNGTPFLFTNH